MIIFKYTYFRLFKFQIIFLCMDEGKINYKLVCINKNFDDQPLNQNKA